MVLHVGGEIGAGERGTDETRAGKIGRNAGAGKIGPVEFRALHLRCGYFGPFHTCAGQIGFEQPCLIQDRAVELRSDELGLVELGRPQDDPRKIEAR